MIDLNQEQKTKLLGLICAAMDGRDTRVHVDQLTGSDCLTVHAVLRHVDALLKAQWILEGQPEVEGVKP
jgi:hypothetical protein